MKNKSKKIDEFLKFFVDNEITRKNYESRLKIYYGIVGRNPDNHIDDIEKHREDLMKFLGSDYVKNVTKLTTKSILNAVLQFIQSNDIELPKSFKKIITTQTKNARPVTQDKILEQRQLREVIMSGDLLERAMFSCLASSGMRVTAFSLLEIYDIDFKTKPTTVHVRAETSKGNKERYCFIDGIASHYLTKYLSKREYYFKNLDKYNYKREINNNLLFPITQHNIARRWRKLLAKNNLSEKDENTGREIYHIHTLRKRFKTVLGVHMAEGLLNSIVGHSGYLGDNYNRYTSEQLRSAYLECEKFISIEPKTVDKKELNGILKGKDAEIKMLKELLIAKSEYEDEQRTRPIAHGVMGEHIEKMSDKEIKYRKLLKQVKDK